MSEEPYLLAITHFFVGTIIIIVNGLLCSSVLADKKLQTAPNVLLTNMWIVNIILGIVTAISNVVVVDSDTDQTMTISTSVSTSEWTVTVVNCFVTVSILLALTTNRLMTIRSHCSSADANRMSLRSVFKLLAVLWSSVFILSSSKTIISSLYKNAPDAVCYACLIGFEMTSLFIFTTVTLCVYCASLYLIIVRKNRTVYDLVTVSQPLRTSLEHFDLSNEYKLTTTVGLMLMNFVFACSSYVLFEAILVAAQSEHIRINPPSGAVDHHRYHRYSNDLIIGVLYAHCLLNPILYIFRDDETRETIRRMLTCNRRTFVRRNENDERYAFVRTPANQRDNRATTIVVVDGAAQL